MNLIGSAGDDPIGWGSLMDNCKCWSINGWKSIKNHEHARIGGARLVPQMLVLAHLGTNRCNNLLYDID